MNKQLDSNKVEIKTIFIYKQKLHLITIEEHFI